MESAVTQARVLLSVLAFGTHVVRSHLICIFFLFITYVPYVIFTVSFNRESQLAILALFWLIKLNILAWADYIVIFKHISILIL